MKKQSNRTEKRPEYMLIGKTLFFPEKGILAVGDLHLGYEEMLKSQGVMVPFNQVQTAKKELTKVFNEIKEGGFELNKIVLLGDIKHHFSYQKGEKFEVRKIMDFLKKYLDEDKIILIKGNHERFELDKRKHYDYYLEDPEDKGGKIAFLHGHKSFSELFDKNIKYLVMGHIHPAVSLKDNQGIKKEKYKCHLVGQFEGKKTFVLPSFFPFIEGSEIEDMDYEGKTPPIIPLKILGEFDVYVVGEDNKNYRFGKYKYF